MINIKNIEILNNNVELMNSSSVRMITTVNEKLQIGNALRDPHKRIIKS